MAVLPSGMGSPSPPVHTPLRSRPSRLGLGHATPGRAPVSSPLGFASLHEMLEREGYKETRIVTPIAKCTHALADMDMNETNNVPLSSSPAPQHYPDIHAWMRGMMATHEQSPAHAEQGASMRPSSSRVGLASEATLQRRRSVLWDASRAYRTAAPTPPVRAAPAITDVPLAFLAEPAQPVVSHEAAVVVQENLPPVPAKPLRTMASRDLLHKTLKRQASTKNLRAPSCTCGRSRDTPQSAFSWHKPAEVDARWHEATCPVRRALEASSVEPIPPAAPSLALSTPHGATKPLSLSGKEYEAREASAHTRLGGWTSVSGLYTLFQGDASDASRANQRKQPRSRRLQRPMSTPYLHPGRVPVPPKTETKPMPRSVYEATPLTAVAHAPSERPRS